jgi:F-box protein 9
MASKSGAEEPDLENFRQQWREEVRAKQARQARNDKGSTPAIYPTSKDHKSADLPKEKPKTVESGPKDGKSSIDLGYEDETVPLELLPTPVLRGKADDRSALELYELAVDSEASGSLGNSLGLYRRALRVGENIYDILKKAYT